MLDGSSISDQEDIRMTTTETTTTALPTGTWALDPVHSEVAFEVVHSGVLVFRGSFRRIQASLEDGNLRGSAEVESIDVGDEALKGHLLAPDFFDAERHPTVEFASAGVAREGDELRIDGELTLRGVTRPVELRGRIAGPTTDQFERTRLGIDLEATIDRTDFGVSWNADLPTGGPYVANDVRLIARLAFVEA
jgi:polyisoprenoid-binding protein YceI